MTLSSLLYALTPILTLTLKLASPLHPRDLPSHGPEGILTPPQRWRDTIGTALQLHGPLSKYSVISTLRSGPLSSVFRASLASNETGRCEPRADAKCEIAINGFGTIGEVQYNFSNNEQKLKGRSTQVMVACRCLFKECGEAMLLRPVNVLSRKTGNQIRRTCLYELVNGKYSDCHMEMMRTSYRPLDRQPEFSHGDNYFEYHPKSKRKDWVAEGRRGWTHDCYEDEIASLRKVDMKLIKPEDITFNNHGTAVNNSCSPPAGVEYVVEENDADGEECAKLYHYAVSGGAHRGTQQDEIATGEWEESYFKEKPELISDTELALVCSAAGLGVLFVWTMYWKQLKKTEITWKILGAVVLAQILSYALEALPLHIALGNEIKAAAWRCLFAFMDGTLSVAKETTAEQGSVRGSVVVLTGVVGEVRYEQTREWLVWVLTVMFDVMVTVVIGMTVLGKAGQICRRRKEEIYVKRRVSGLKGKRRKRIRIRRKLLRKEDDLDKSDEGWSTLSTRTPSGTDSGVQSTSICPTYRWPWRDSLGVLQGHAMGQTRGIMNTVASPTSSSTSSPESVCPTYRWPWRDSLGVLQGHAMGQTREIMNTVASPTSSSTSSPESVVVTFHEESRT